MIYLYITEDDIVPKQFSTVRDSSIAEEHMVGVEDENAVIVRFNSGLDDGKGGFERAIVTSDTTSEDDGDEEGETTYEVSHWEPIANG